MRIVLLPSAYAPAIGGVEELTAGLAKRLSGVGDDVEVWTIRHPADSPQRDEIEGIAVRRFSLPLPRLSLVDALGFPQAARRASRALLEAADTFAPDVLHVQCFSANGVYATWLAQRLHVPLVVSLQGETLMDDSDIYDRSLTLRLALRLALRRAEIVTGCSRFALEDAEARFGLRHGKGVVVPNGVELDEGARPEALDLPFDRFVLGLGRVVAKKGFDLLLEAFALLADRHPSLGLLIGGEGSERMELTRAAAARGLAARVVLPGALTRGQVAWAMTTADAFVLSSRLEPFGIVVLEALRAGCPAIVSARGGATEIVRDGVDGLVVDPCDVDALAAAIERVLSDPALAAELAVAGHNRAAQFTWDAIRGRYRSLYEHAGAGGE